MKEDTSLIKPYNPTDPIVVLDPTINNNVVVRKYSNGDETASETASQNQEETNINYEGIYAPIIQLNNRSLDCGLIETMWIDYTEFVPKLSLTIKDENKNMQFSDVPGMNNKIIIILTAPVDGVTKKISLEFYITKCDFNDKGVSYEAIYKCQALEKVLFKQIGKGKLTTYELLKQIATDTGLGFAATDNEKKCSGIKDKRYRIVHSLKLKDYIKKQIDISGVDEDNVFDAWVDIFGYIVLINVKYVMNANIQPTQLATHVISGEKSTSSDAIKQEVILVNRTLSNNTNSPKNNLQFTHYDSVVYNDLIVNEGALNNYYIFGSPASGNNVNLKQIQTIESSIDGMHGSNEYENENIEFLGVEMSDDIPILYQKQLNRKYLNKLRSSQLEIMLTTPNYGLERGTLVNVMIFDYNMGHKQIIATNYDNAVNVSNELANPKTENTEVDKSDVDNKIANESDGLLNPSLSGTYYIDSMKFIYDADNKVINQYLYLIKRGVKNNLINKYNFAKIQK